MVVALRIRALGENRLGNLDGLLRLDEKVVIVTGGYGGIGEVVVRGLAGMGARLVIAGQNSEKAAACAQVLQNEGHSALGVAFDVLSAAETRRMVQQAAEHFGRVDILVNCIGLNIEQKAEEITEEAFDRVLHVNLRGMMFQAQAAAQQMIQQGGGGKQVHMGSVRTLLGLRGRGFASYCAAKGGMAILCKQLSAEWAVHKINVNLLAPTFVRTQQVEYMLSDKTFYDALIARIPLGRIGTPQDVLNAILFFVSSASDFITGQTLYLDGGLTATQ